jgi:hypothetical protein
MWSRSEHAQFGPTHPVDIVVDADRPTFEWNPAELASAYRVSIFDQRYRLVRMSGWMLATLWIVDTPLQRGESYVWQVTARTGAQDIVAPTPPQREARFRVTTAEQSARLLELRRRTGDSHVALAIVLAEAGVLDEAERELKLARLANPYSSAVTRIQAVLEAMRK